LRNTLLTLAIAGSAVSAPLVARAQALPDAVREAGVTLIQWQSVLAEVQRSATEKHVSERALAVVCTKMGVELAKGHHFDLSQMILLISGRADEINALYQKLSLDEQQNNPEAAGLLKQARASIDAGDLDQAEGFLKRASIAARSAIENAQRQEAAITATDAQVRALEFDYLGAAAVYAEAASELPAGDAHDRWTYVVKQADNLEQRGELFDEPQPLHDALTLYRDTALPLAPRGAEPDTWAETQKHMGTALLVLGERGDEQDLEAALAADRAALEVWTRDSDPAHWALAQSNLGYALEVLGARGDANVLHDAIAADRAALEVWTRDSDPVGWARVQVNLGTTLELLVEHGDEAALRDAVVAYTAALEVYAPQTHPAQAASALNSIAWAYHVAGKDAQGLPEAERSLALDPTNANVLETRAEIRERLGQREGAIADYRAALLRRPDMKDAKDGLARLGATEAAPAAQAR
jgi:hypothetical protein